MNALQFLRLSQLNRWTVSTFIRTKQTAHCLQIHPVKTNKQTSLYLYPAMTNKLLIVFVLSTQYEYKFIWWYYDEFSECFFHLHFRSIMGATTSKFPAFLTFFFSPFPRENKTGKNKNSVIQNNSLFEIELYVCDPKRELTLFPKPAENDVNDLSKIKSLIWQVKRNSMLFLYFSLSLLVGIHKRKKIFKYPHIYLDSR